MSLLRGVFLIDHASDQVRSAGQIGLSFPKVIQPLQLLRRQNDLKPDLLRLGRCLAHKSKITQITHRMQA